MKQYSCLISLAIFFALIQMTSSKSLINSTCLDIAREDPNIDYGFCTTSLQASPASLCSTLSGCLNDCFQLYSDAIPSVKQAMRDYTKKRFDNAKVEITSIMDGADTCEEGFKEKRGVVSPLTERNNHTFQLSAMALSILHIIQEPSQPGL